MPKIIERKDKVGMGVIANPKLGLFSCGSEAGDWTVRIKISETETVKVYTYFEKDGVYFANSTSHSTQSPDYRLNATKKLWEPVLRD